MSFLQRFKYWVPVILAMAFIYWMSTDLFSSVHTSRVIEPIVRFFVPQISRKQMLLVQNVIRKLAHVTEYFILGVLLFRAFRAGSEERQWRRWALSALAVVMLYASADELHQYFVSTRTASLADVGLDTLGGVLAQCVSVVWYGRRRTETTK
jgi:VanZ family protein